MSKNFVQSATIRSAALGAYRVYARSQVWRRGPRVFVNSIPKAGTHLLTAELSKFPGMQNSRLHLALADLRADYRLPAVDAKYDIKRLTRRISTVRNGQFFSAHLPWASELADILKETQLRTIFVVRDPRAIIVSRLHYIVGLKRHRLHAFLTSRFHTDVARYHALIDGHPNNPSFPSLSQTLLCFAGWMTTDDVLTIRFEDLVGERGGGSTEAKRGALLRISNHCGLAGDRLDAIALAPTTTTPTLRKGRADAWRDELPIEIRRRIDHECGDLLEQFGYSRGD